MKKIFKSRVFVFVLGILASGTFVYATEQILASDVLYHNKTVKQALDELYQLKDNTSNYTETYTFNYKNDEETFIAPYTGLYKLEVWGAQGASYEGYIGGYGSYSIGYINLNKNDTLYVNVGGKGTNNQGGYNGGGSPSGFVGSVAGGGATHIATASGELKDLVDDKSAVLLVAAGGGGADERQSSNGAHGGGYIGNSSSKSMYGMATGGTQLDGGQSANSSATNGSFGLGGSQTNINNSGGGGGGGYYGGAGGYGSAGGGGSGYIASANLISSNDIIKHMYCYDCATSTANDTYTISNDTISCYSEIPMIDCAKKENGSAKITYLGN